MAPSSSRDAEYNIPDSDNFATAGITLTFPTSGRLESTEQIRRFELLRLAFFALKLRKLERHIGGQETKEQTSELDFRRSLLRHVIFQQVLTLIQLDARQQAMQIIEACQK